MSPVITNLLLKSLAETLYMLSISAIIAALIGIPLGILLVVTEKNGILSCPVLNKPLAFVINLIRSIPFIILMVAIIPFTRLVAGTSIGTTAAIVPLTIAAIPYTARMVETSIREIPFGLIEAAESMGASPLQIIWKVLIPEALPSIIESLTVVIVSLIGASAMAGTIGGGGLGDLAIRYGYQRFQADVMIATIIVLVIIVQLIQFIGSNLAKKADKR
ncbi:methionine ABC transporter permease [Dialister sp.]|uniref:methionine ABC transporter permease n=1 Tax=Dialister sp. TaxID=1955814 RepID=UPI003EFEC0D3